MKAKANQYSDDVRLRVFGLVFVADRASGQSYTTQLFEYECILYMVE